MPHITDPQALSYSFSGLSSVLHGGHRRLFSMKETFNFTFIKTEPSPFNYFPKRIFPSPNYNFIFFTKMRHLGIVRVCSPQHSKHFLCIIHYPESPNCVSFLHAEISGHLWSTPVHFCCPCNYHLLSSSQLQNWSTPPNTRALCWVLLSLGFSIMRTSLLDLFTFHKDIYFLY
jgi:hypothetical protein